MTSATQRALADRAIEAANLMEFWIKHIAEEAAKGDVHVAMPKGIIPSPEESRAYQNREVTIRIERLEAMFANMRILIKSIRKFEQNLANQRARIHKRT